MKEESGKNQYFAALVVAILSICYGIVIGWSSPTIDLLMSNDTPLSSGKITIEEGSWIASLLAIGSIFGNLLIGYMTNKFGRKWALNFLSVPMIVSWVLVIFAQNVYYLFVARVLHGIITGGALVVAPVFLQEISTDRNRGALVSSVTLSGNYGMILAFILGAFCNFYATPIIVISLTIVFVILFSFFPETPTFLVKKDKIAEARKSLRFYRNINGNDSLLINLEIQKLKMAIGNLETKQGIGKSLKWTDLTTRPGSKALTIGTVLSALIQLCGCFALISYAAQIFAESGSALSPNVSAIVIGVLQFCGNISLTLLVDRAGRKFLYIVSTTGVTLGYITLAIYMIMKSSHPELESFNWIPIVSLSFVIYIASWAVSSLPFAVCTEIMPENLKEFGFTYCNLLMSICAFIAIKFFPLLTQSLGLHGSVLVFAGITMSSAVYIILCMPETRGKSYEQIMESLQ